MDMSRGIKPIDAAWSDHEDLCYACRLIPSSGHKLRSCASCKTVRWILNP